MEFSFTVSSAQLLFLKRKIILKTELWLHSPRYVNVLHSYAHGQIFFCCSLKSSKSSEPQQWFVTCVIPNTSVFCFGDHGSCLADCLLSCVLKISLTAELWIVKEFGGETAKLNAGFHYGHLSFWQIKRYRVFNLSIWLKDKIKQFYKKCYSI